MPDWKHRIGLIARALVVTENEIIVAGPPDTIANEPLNTPEFNQERVIQKMQAKHEIHSGKKHGLLMVFSRKDGSLFSQQTLPSPRVFNGMIISHERLILSSAQGKLTCYK
ncbi:MAG: hypothetical protein HQL32_16640 [Planctomycetes bacterium]|nr:hypothetical protein [Planctomycetota bacterium]